MPSKSFQLEHDLIITVYKRRNNRNLKISMSPIGEVRVTVPSWAPYGAGLAFAKSKIEWISQHRTRPNFLVNSQEIGKAHHLSFVLDDNISKPTTRIKDNTIIVKYPRSADINDVQIQQVAYKACIRALRQQAQELLPQRLTTLADQNNYSYSAVSIRQLRGRWGSCDQNKNITLNLFLMQLPWDQIDYVLLHELAHTKVLKHGPEFWAEMEKSIDDPKAYRKKLKDHQPVLK